MAATDKEFKLEKQTLFGRSLDDRGQFEAGRRIIMSGLVSVLLETAPNE